MKRLVDHDIANKQQKQRRGIHESPSLTATSPMPPTTRSLAPFELMPSEAEHLFACNQYLTHLIEQCTLPLDLYRPIMSLLALLYTETGAPEPNHFFREPILDWLRQNTAILPKQHSHDQQEDTPRLFIYVSEDRRLYQNVIVISVFQSRENFTVNRIDYYNYREYDKLLFVLQLHCYCITKGQIYLMDKDTCDSATVQHLVISMRDKAVSIYEDPVSTANYVRQNKEACVILLVQTLTAQRLRLRDDMPLDVSTRLIDSLREIEKTVMTIGFGGVHNNPAFISMNQLAFGLTVLVTRAHLDCL